MPNEVWEEVKCELTEVAKNIIGIKTQQRRVKQDSKEAFQHVGDSRELQIRMSFAKSIKMKPVEEEEGLYKRRKTRTWQLGRRDLILVSSFF